MKNTIKQSPQRVVERRKHRLGIAMVDVLIVRQDDIYYSLPAIVPINGGIINLEERLNTDLTLTDGHTHLRAAQAEAEVIAQQRHDAMLMSWGPTLNPADQNLAETLRHQEDLDAETVKPILSAFGANLDTTILH